MKARKIKARNDRRYTCSILINRLFAMIENDRGQMAALQPTTVPALFDRPITVPADTPPKIRVARKKDGILHAEFNTMVEAEAAIAKAKAQKKAALFIDQLEPVAA